MIPKLLVLLLCLLLAGCSPRPAAQKSPAPPRLSPTKETENDNLRCYPLDGSDCRFFVVGEDLLLVNSDRLRRYAGKSLLLSAEYTLPSPNCTVQAEAAGICVFCPETQEAVLLEPNLVPRCTVALPQIEGAPLLCKDAGHLYYCTASALLAVELETGIHRLLRDGLPAPLRIDAALEDTGTLVCTGDAQTEYNSSADGSRLAVSPPVSAVGDSGHIAVHCGSNDCLYLGSGMLPLVPGWHFLAFCPDGNEFLAALPGNQLVLFDFRSGNRIAQIALPDPPAAAAVTADGRIFAAAQEGNCLYQWTPERNPVRDIRIRFSPVYTRDAPDSGGLEQCRQRASYIEKQYHLKILLNEDAVRIRSGDFTAAPEHLAAILMETLDQIEKSLTRLPAEFVRQTVDISGSTFLCLVREIRQGDRTLDSCQLWSGQDSWLMVAANASAADSVIAALCPMVESRIRTQSAALDDPDMTGRASLLLDAITPGNRELFTDARLQKQLRRLCLGIRQAYTLSGDSFPWEQYLWDPV